MKYASVLVRDTDFYFSLFVISLVLFQVIVGFFVFLGSEPRA
jgi:hypothetical protein